ncbi:hypothetical protein [Ensifer sp. LC163]|uniref:hypothetical protein n=1 Tax=Ensifer sp. LC163 TaxID=1120652 RepID=UPI000A9270F7|nr:hypothetical protein [Ensifer sp. LC163]
MPRTGGVYTPPAGTKGVPNTTIQSVPYNTLIDDLAADANAARPVTAGGTGATSASGARTALGVEVGTNVQAYDAGLQSIAGLVTVADQIIYTTALDVYATTALTPFARTLLDDVDAAAARATLGANNATNLTTGTIADARLPTTQTAKTFTGTVVGTRIELSGSYVTSGQELVFNNNSNKHIWFRNAAGTNRALLYNEVTDNSLRLNLYNSSGAFVRAVTFRESDGLLDVAGPIASTGLTTGDVTASRGNGTGVIFLGGGSRYLHYDGANYSMPAAGLGIGGNLTITGGAIYQGDGNVYMPWAGNYLSNVLNSKITTDGRAYPRRVGGGDLNMNWSGQGGQPSWLWGGNDGVNMYVYNPSNFNVNYATGAGNADTVDGYHASAFAQVYTGSNAAETNFPIGHLVLAWSNAAAGARNVAQGVWIDSGSNWQYLNYASGAALAGTWRTRGTESGNYALMQRTA